MQCLKVPTGLFKHLHLKVCKKRYLTECEIWLDTPFYVCADRYIICADYFLRSAENLLSFARFNCAIF